MKFVGLMLAIVFAVGCIEAPLDGRDETHEDRDRPTEVELDVGEQEVVTDLNQGRTDVTAPTIVDPVKNPFPDGRDAPRPDLSVEPREDLGHDENGRTPEDIANRKDLG